MQIIIGIKPTFLISAVFLQIILIVSNNTKAQCLSGDCDNGTGLTKLSAGIYTGSFKAGEPSGEGVYQGLRYRAGSRVDSVREEGFFTNGIFLKGKRTIIHSWEEVEVPSEWYANKGGVWMGKAYRFESASFTQDFGKTWDYPYYKTNKVTVTDNKGKSKSREENYIEFDEGTYTGEIKNGLPNGKGVFKRNNFYFTGVFENGLPIAQTPDFYNLIERPLNYPVKLKLIQLDLQNMRFENGLLTALTIADKDSAFTYTLQKPVSSVDFIYKGDYNGFFQEARL